MRIRLSRQKGWRMPLGTQKVDRSTVFGNPFSPELHGQQAAVDMFRAWLAGQLVVGQMSEQEREALTTRRRRIISELPRLAGLNLACWCAEDLPCHATVLLEFANMPRCEAA
jgi:hypothetical protein